MERRFKPRLTQVLDDAVVDPAVSRGVLPRLERFVQPFAAGLQRQQQEDHLQQYLAGSVSDLRRKNVESIAYHHDHDRQALQKFIGRAPWDHRPLLTELARQVGAELGEADGVLVFDPSAFPKRGIESVGVRRQWCGRLGKIDNCQVGVYLGYVARAEHALVDLRLYLPQGWAKDRERRKEAGVPKGIRFRTRHPLAPEMLREKGPVSPHAWVAGDDEMGRSTRFRRDLRGPDERYLLAVPSGTLIRDNAAEPPPSPGRGPRPKVPSVRVDRWAAALPEAAWETIAVRDGEQGPLVVQAVKAPVAAKAERRRAGPDEVLVVIRARRADGAVEHAYHLPNAAPETPLAEFARVAQAEHRIGDCLRRAKGEAGLADYEVRTWEGWHHHQALSFIATRFLTREARRGKKMGPGDYSPPDPLGYRPVPAGVIGLRPPGANLPHGYASPPAKRAGAVLSLEVIETLGTPKG